MKKYLIIKIAAIGDVIMAMPMVRKIRQEEPQSHITWVCGKSVYSLLQKLPIDKLIVVDEKKLLGGSKPEKVKEVIRVWKQIGGQYFDVVAMGHADPRYHMLTAFTKYGVYHSFSHTIGKSWRIPGRHHSDEYVRMISDHLSKEEITAPYHIDVEKDSGVDEALTGKKKIITLTPGGAKNVLADDFCRRWPIENYVRLAKLLITEGMTVVISGAPSDQWIEPYFENLPVINLVGKTTLDGLLYLFSKSDVVVTHDSGPMHLAGMTDCKMVALFGPTNPDEKVPRREGVQYIWEKDKYSCCPCYDGKTYAPCKDNVCLRNINPNTVMFRIKDMLEQF